MSEPKYACIDLDGTIAHYDTWHGEEVFGEPVEGAKTSLEKLREREWKIIIYTTRSNLALIENYLHKNSIPFDYINYNPDQPENAMGGKPFADVYIDDRGIQFNGNWSVTLNEILHFAPWEKRTELNQGDEYLKESIKFLESDFSEANTHFRAYDAQIWEITKFSFLELIGSIGAVWTVFALTGSADAPDLIKPLWGLVGSIILILSYCFCGLAILYIMRIRVYFVRTAWYINDQRNFFLSTIPIGFGNRSNYYTDYKSPEINDGDSTQLISTYFLSILSSFNLGLGIGLLLFYLKVLPVYALLIGMIAWIVVSIVEIRYVIVYLKRQGK
jgi:hypothetical protein